MVSETPVAESASQVESPCVKVCTLNDEQICMGCGRTVAEIAIWSQADDYLRRDIVVAARRRRLELEPGLEAGDLPSPAA